MDATSRRYLNDKRIKYTIQAYKSSLSPPLTHFHLLLTPNHRTDHRTDLLTDVTGSSHECRRVEKLQDTIGRQVGRGARCRNVLQRRSKVAEQQQHSRNKSDRKSPTSKRPARRTSFREGPMTRARPAIETGTTQHFRAQPMVAEERGSMESEDRTRRWRPWPLSGWSAVTGRMSQPTQTNPGLVQTGAAPLQGADSGRPSSRSRGESRVMTSTPRIAPRGNRQTRKGIPATGSGP